MTKSEEWQQFSAYAPMIEDAIQRGRNQREQELIALLEDKLDEYYPSVDYDVAYMNGFSEAIELIKGDNNE